MVAYSQHTHYQVALADIQTKTWQRVFLPQRKTNGQTDEKKEALGGNSTYPKVAVQWLNQALCFYQSLCFFDSEVLRNRHLRVAANR